MDTIAFYGRFATGDADVVARLLRDWLETDEQNITVGLLGVEIVHEVDGLYLYCHEADTGPHPPCFLLEGTLPGTLGAANARLSGLARLCAARGVGCRLDYVLMDEDGNEASAESTVTSDDQAETGTDRG